jgi:hypothetical protein
MGRVRKSSFDAVIGVGGKSPDRGHKSIANKINWVGIKPQVVGNRLRGPLLTFESFVLLEENGPHVKDLAPHLFKYMFEDKNVRLVMSQNLPTEILRQEVQEILRWATEHAQSRKFRSILIPENRGSLVTPAPAGTRTNLKDSRVGARVAKLRLRQTTPRPLRQMLERLMNGRRSNRADQRTPTTAATRARPAASRLHVEAFLFR